MICSESPSWKVGELGFKRKSVLLRGESRGHLVPHHCPFSLLFEPWETPPPPLHPRGLDSVMREGDRQWLGHQTGPTVHSEATAWLFHGEHRRLVTIPTWSIFGQTLECLSVPVVRGPGQALELEPGKGLEPGEPEMSWALPCALRPPSPGHRPSASQKDHSKAGRGQDASSPRTPRPP